MNLDNKSTDANELPHPTGSFKAFVNSTQSSRISPLIHLPKETACS